MRRRDGHDPAIGRSGPLGQAIVIDRRGDRQDIADRLDPHAPPDACEHGKLSTPGVLDTFMLFVEPVAAQLVGHRDLAKQGRELKAEGAFGRLREEFLAVLGHDPRDPVTAIMAGARILG